MGETLDSEEEQHQEAADPESATTPNAPRCGRRCLPTGSALPDASRLTGGNESANPVPRRHLIASSAATGYRGSCALVGHVATAHRSTLLLLPTTAGPSPLLRSPS